MLGPTSPSGRLAVWQQQVSSVDREPGHFALGDRRTEIGQGAGSRPPTSHNTGRTDHVSGVSRHLKRYCRYYGLCCCMAIPTSHEAGSPMTGMQPSQGNARDLHAVSVGSTWRRSVQVLGITALGLLTHTASPPSASCAVEPALCLQLPSDSGSLRAPLPFGYHVPLSGVEGTFTPESPSPPPRGRG